jgi:alkane 1-monooxygenase
MDPRVAAHYGGDLSKANRGRAPEPAMVTRDQTVLGDAPAARCPGCGYTYVVAKGDEHEGLPAGTPWSAIADDWCCPDCGVRSKQDFTRVEAIPLDR